MMLNYRWGKSIEDGVLNYCCGCIHKLNVCVYAHTCQTWVISHNIIKLTCFDNQKSLGCECSVYRLQHSPTQLLFTDRFGIRLMTRRGGPVGRGAGRGVGRLCPLTPRLQCKGQWSLLGVPFACGHILEFRKIRRHQMLKGVKIDPVIFQPMPRHEGVTADPGSGFNAEETCEISCFDRGTLVLRLAPV